MQDTFKHKGLRKRLVDEIRKKGIHDENVLQAIEKIPRHLFMDSSFIAFAYEDKPFPISSGQTISQPYTVAFQTQLLQVKKGEKILEIGTGSGFQSCVLVEMGAKVFSIERQKLLYDKAKQFLPSIGYSSVKLFFGDGYKGLPTFAPFDKIIVTAGAPFIPNDLIIQLKIGGILVIPVGETDAQVMTTISKISEKECKKVTYGNFSFVPLLENRVDI